MLRIKANLNNDKNLIELDIEFEDKNIGKLEISKFEFFDFIDEFALILDRIWTEHKIPFKANKETLNFLKKELYFWR